MNIAFCYENVLPARGGCETYIADLARRLIADQHNVHLYACRWDEGALPRGMQYHAIPAMRGQRFLRPWRFARACLKALANAGHDITVGFDKTFGQDILYPQGGLHSASFEHNLDKNRQKWRRGLTRIVKLFDLAHWSFTMLEHRQYLGADRPLIIVNSAMVKDHFQLYLGISASKLHMIRSAIDPSRFPEHDRLRRRQEFRDRWRIAPTEVVGLFAAMNYRLKGLEPLLRGVKQFLTVERANDADRPLRLVVAGNPHFGGYEKLAQALGIQDRLTFIGHCAEMRQAYFAADFLVHPTFYDPCSLVVLEALACGLPIITTRFNGASELLRPPSEGFVIEDPHDHGQLAWCMAQMLDSPRRHAMSLAARRAAAEWTFEHHYRQLLDVFAEVARRKRAA